jgi:hypothetical protein
LFYSRILNKYVRESSELSIILNTCLHFSFYKKVEQIDPGGRPPDDYNLQQKLEKAREILQRHFTREYYTNYVKPALEEVRAKPELICTAPRFRDDKCYRGFVFPHTMSLARRLIAEKAHLNGLSKIGLIDFVNEVLEPLIARAYAHQHPEKVL